MEVVLATSIAAQVLASLAERALRPAGRHLAFTEPISSPLQTTGSGSHTPSSTEVQEATDPQDESLPNLQRRLKNLRSEARSLNTADKFVQYARVTREATLLEAKIEEIQATLPSNNGTTVLSVLERQLRANGMALPFPIDLLNRDVHASRSYAVAKYAFGAGARFFVTILSLFFLWVFFRQRGDLGIMQVDCDVLWPISRFLATRELPACTGEDELCPAGVECIVSYYPFALLCNALVYRVRNLAFRRA